MKRTLLAGAALAVLALTGCSTPPAAPEVASAGGGTGRPHVSATPNAVAAYLEAQRKYAQCLRAGGIEVADPDADGNVDISDVKRKRDRQQLAVLTRCGKGLPPRPRELGDKGKQPLSKDEIERARRYARCMQANGAPDFPDPGPDGYFDGDGPEWDETSAGAQRALRICTPIVQPTPLPGSG